MPFGLRKTQSDGGSAPGSIALAVSLACFALAVPAGAQNGERQDTVGEDAIDAVTQPLTDLNLRSRDIPAILLRAQQVPYELETLEACGDLRSEVALLDEVLGPDADAPPEEVGMVNRGLRLGGDVIGGMIPFRGLVRRISGAHEHEKRWEAAIYAGVARRSFLKGVMSGRACLSEEEEAVRSARDLLGLAPDAPAEGGLPVEATR